MTATIRMVRPARAGFASTSRTSAMGQVSGKEAGMMTMRLYIITMTDRGVIVTDGEGAGLWRLDADATATLSQAVAAGETRVDLVSAGRAQIAGREFAFSE